MTIRPEIFELVEEYVDEHEVDASPEAMFIEFENMVRTHEEFNRHCIDTGLTIKLNAMKRSERLRAKIKLSAHGRMVKNINNGNINLKP